MKWIFVLLTFMLFACNQQNDELSADAIERIKEDIIKSSERHAQGIENLDYETVMEFYGEVEDFVIFGDGYYWGDYLTCSGIWKDFLNPENWRKMVRWDLSNHKVSVISNDAASYLVEFDNVRVSMTGDTTIVKGCFTYGMKKIGEDWKAVTVHVTHNYKPGYGYENSQPGYYVKEQGKDWWHSYSPELREE